MIKPKPERIALDDTDFDTFTSEIKNPSKPTPKLVALFRKRRLTPSNRRSL